MSIVKKKNEICFIMNNDKQIIIGTMDRVLMSFGWSTIAETCKIINELILKEQKTTNFICVLIVRSGDQPYFLPGHFDDNDELNEKMTLYTLQDIPICDQELDTQIKLPHYFVEVRNELQSDVNI